MSSEIVSFFVYFRLFLVTFLFVMSSKQQPVVACVEKKKSIMLQILLDAEMSDFYVSVYKISKRNTDCDWLNVAGSDLRPVLLLRGPMTPALPPSSL